MSDDDRPATNGSGHDLIDPRERAVDELGRRVGAELRRPAPAGGAAAVMRHARNQRLTRVAVAAAGVAAFATVGVAVLTGDDPATIRTSPEHSVATSPAPPTLVSSTSTTAPTTPDTTLPAATLPAVAVPSSVSAACRPIDTDAPHADDFVSLTDTEYWTMSPLSCGDGDSAVAAFDLTRTALTEPTRSNTWRVPLAALEAAVPGLSITPMTVDGRSIPWGDLRLVGVSGDLAFVRTETALARLDAANQRIEGLVLPANQPGLVGLPVTLLGDTTFVFDERGEIARVDFQAGTLTALPAVAQYGFTMSWRGPGEYRIPRSPGEQWAMTYSTSPDRQCYLPEPGVPSTATPSLPVCVQDTAIAIRADGTTSTFTIEGSLIQLYSGGGSVWGLVYLPGEEAAIDPQHLAHPVRIDPATGELLVLLDAPAGSFSWSFQAYVNADGMLAVSDRQRAWWIGNDGVSEQLAPLPFDIVGITQTAYVARNDDGTVAVGEIASLPRAVPLTTTP